MSPENPPTNLQYMGRPPATFASRRSVRNMDGSPAVNLSVLRGESSLILMSFGIDEFDRKKIIYDNRLKTSGGSCMWIGGHPSKRSIIKIAINPLIEEPLDIWEVLAHELSHGIQVLTKGYTAHDEDFYRICRIVLDSLGLTRSKPYRCHSIKSLYKHRRKA